MAVPTPFSARLGLVVSYYNPKGLPALRAQTELCAIKALASQDGMLAVDVLVSDGTGWPDPELQERLARQGITYRFSDRPLGFAQGYNQGLRHFAEKDGGPDLLATCANDVFCDAPTLPLLAGALMSDATVGCAMPYLSQSDYLTQNDWVLKRYRRAGSMTLNLNLFRTADLAALGYVPEAFSGYFNDLALMIELRRLGKRVMIINGGNVVHLGRATTSTASSARLEADIATFRRLYPDYALGGESAVRLEALAAGRAARWFRARQARATGAPRRILTGLERLYRAWELFWHQDLRGRRM